MNFLQSKL